MLAAVGVPRGDLALELLSWIGVLLAAMLATVKSSSPTIWAGLPAALWVMCGIHTTHVTFGFHADRRPGPWCDIALRFYRCKYNGFRYLSLINLEAREVIGYGWEWETCEIGFLIIWLCPMIPSRASGFSTPTIIIWLLRWSTFRLLIGAGMSKLGERSSACWMELSCTETHYFTQPMPNMLAWGFHRA